MQIQLVNDFPFPKHSGGNGSYRVYSSNDIVCLYFDSRITQTHTSVTFTIVHSCKAINAIFHSIGTFPCIHTYYGDLKEKNL
jgi:hypothetical protein